MKQISKKSTPPQRSQWYVQATEQLVSVVQDLSSARDLDSIAQIIREAARNITNADGATFVLRDDTMCYYAEENAIAPLWKGQRFPMSHCISGWVMLNARPAIIEDIYKDSRIPIDAYRPTFVKSLAMVPINLKSPVGAIGNYWKKHYTPTDEEVGILQTLANFTSIAIENVQLYLRLQDKIGKLQQSNYELGSFAWAAAHDLKSPLRAIDNLSNWIEEEIDNQNPDAAKKYIKTLQQRVLRTEKLLDSILEYSRVEYKLNSKEDEMVKGNMLKEDILSLINLPKSFKLEFPENFGQVFLPRIAAQRVFCGLIGNAIKHHDKDKGLIQVSVDIQGPNYVFKIKDDGPGVPPEYAEKIFEMFQTLKSKDQVEGSGMGLKIVKKILSVYGGTINMDPPSGRGTVFTFTWPKNFDA